MNDTTASVIYKCRPTEEGKKNMNPNTRVRITVDGFIARIEPISTGEIMVIIEGDVIELASIKVS